jgi:hypothetical protein
MTRKILELWQEKLIAMESALWFIEALESSQRMCDELDKELHGDLPTLESYHYSAFVVDPKALFRHVTGT